MQDISFNLDLFIWRKYCIMIKIVYRRGCLDISRRMALEEIMHEFMELMGLLLIIGKKLGILVSVPNGIALGSISN